MADNKPTADQIQFALDLAKEKGKDYTKSKLQGMSGKEVSDAIDSMKDEETEASGKQVSFALDLLKEQGKSSPSKAQLDKMPAANISKLIDKLKGSEKKAKTAGMFNALDSDQESLAEELYMMASNDGAAYQKRDADGAAKRAMRELQQSKTRDLAYDMKMAHKAVVKALKARWRQSDKEHRQNQRAASMKKQAIVQEVMKRAKADPEFRKKVVARVRVANAGRVLQNAIRVTDEASQMSPGERDFIEGPLKQLLRMAPKLPPQTNPQFKRRVTDLLRLAPKVLDDSRASSKMQDQLARLSNYLQKHYLAYKENLDYEWTPELARSLSRRVAMVQKKAKPGGGPVSKKDYDGFFKHLMAAYKIASKWEEQDKPGGYVANESIGAFMEKLKRDMKKHVK